MLIDLMPAMAKAIDKLPLERLLIYPARVPYPKYIQVETMNGCNLNCVMCDKEGRNRLGREQGRLTMHGFSEIISQFTHLKGVSLHGLGEPLLNKDLF